MANIAGILELYTAYFNRAADKDGVDYWANEMDNNGWTLDDVANSFADQVEYKTMYDGKTNAEIVALVYTNVLNRDADPAGAAYWEAELDSGAVTVSQIIQAVVNGATEMVDGVYKNPTDAAIVNNKTEVSQYAYDTNSNATDISLAGVTEDKASTESAKKQIDAENPANIGKTQYLKVTQDKLDGTDKDDTFLSDVAQNQNGQQVNTLGSGDIINGGAGNDTLDATLIAAYNVAGKAMDITPTTKSIEIVNINAQISDYKPGTAPGTVVHEDEVILNARKMTGIEKISSKYSDADLLVKNMTTNGVAGGTDAQTVAMEHTGNADSAWDESNMTVFYDQDYLVRSSQEINALDLILLNAVNNAEGENPVEGFKTINFKVGNVGVKVDVSDIAAKTTGLDSIYQDVANKINAKLAELELTTVKATVLPEVKGFFSIPIPPFAAGSSAGNYNPIRITNLGEEALIGETIETSKLDYKTELNGVFNEVDTETNNTPVTINVDLEKVGLAGHGGGLVIGSMNKTTTNTFNAKESTTDTVAGFDEFKVSVNGAADKASSLSYLESTNNTLRKVEVTSEDRSKEKDKSNADLTIGNVNTDGLGAFGTSAANAKALKDVQVFDASKFKGDLKLYAGITAEIAAKYFDNTELGLYSLNNGKELATFKYDGGEANDVLNIAINTNAIAYSFGQYDASALAGAAIAALTKIDANSDREIAANKFAMNINGNAGNDTINISMDALTDLRGAAAVGNLDQDFRDYKLGATGIVINGGAGNDTIDLEATASTADWSFTVAFSGTNFGHDIINNFDVSGAAINATTNAKQQTDEVQVLNLTGFKAHKDEIIKVSVGDKVYEVKATANMTNAQVITAVTDILEATNTSALNDKNTTQDYFTVTPQTVLTSVLNLVGNTTTGGGLTGYKGKDVGTVKVEISTGSETNVNYEKIPPLHTSTADTIQQGGQLWYGDNTAASPDGNGADFLDFTAYTAKGVVMVDNNGSANKITATGSTSAVGDKLVFLVESIHDDSVYNVYTGTVQTAGATDFNAAGTNAIQNKVLLGSIDLGSDVNTAAAATNINADQFLF